MRLVASDLDGTIVRPDGTVSARTLAALDRCQANGVSIVFVTGRPMRWMAPIVAATGHRGVAVCANGAAIYDLGREQVISTRALTAQTVLQTAKALRAVLPEAVFALETTIAEFRREPGYLPRFVYAEQVRVGGLPELLADDPVVIKMLCRVDGGQADQMLALARPALADLAEPVHSDGAGSLLEISALGVSKATTLAMVAQQRAIDPAAVVAFGDMPNDVPMLRWAGRGYAMADGHAEAIAAADDIAPPCAQDGVAQVLELLLDTHVGPTE